MSPRSFNSSWTSTPTAYLVTSGGGNTAPHSGNYLNRGCFPATAGRRGVRLGLPPLSDDGGARRGLVALRFKAAARLRSPVPPSAETSSPAKAAAVLAATGCAGVMVGRHAIRNPWIFRQLRERFAGDTVFVPTLGDVREYIDRLHRATANPLAPEFARTGKLKKYLNFVAQ